MFKTTGKRIVFLFLLVWVVSSLTFFLIRFVPGDPARYLLGARAGQQDIQRLREELALDRPLWDQFWEFQGRLFHLDFGRSFFNGKKVFSNIGNYLPNTLLLSLAAMFTALVISFPIGAVAAFKSDSIFDLSVTVFSSLGLSLPNFILGPLLIMVFSVHLGWLPVSGSGGWQYLILPSLTLGLSMSAQLVRIVKVAVNMELSKPYVLLARSKGLAESKVFFRHVLKNAIPIILSTIGLQMGALITGTIITETIFSWEGIGRLLIKSVYRRDYPMIQGLVIIITALYLFVSLLVDMILILTNPKHRYEVRD
jgi:peptide/nickel transport system permease protein